MPTRLAADFEVTGWKEQTVAPDVFDARMTRAMVTKSYHDDDDVEGDSTTIWVLSYEGGGTATFVGLERIVGRVAGRRGELVLQHVGHYAEGAAVAELTVVLGTDELEGVTGTGSFRADPKGTIRLELDLPDDGRDANGAPN